MSQADSIAVDPHKWLYAPLEAGCVLVRDPEALRRAFSYHPAYYHFDEQVVNFFELGPQNSRGFRALKVWLALRQVGRDGYRRMIADDMLLAEHLFERVSQHPDFEPFTQSLSITTFRYVPADLRRRSASTRPKRYLDRLNHELLAAIERSGDAFLSSAVVNGRFALRACVVNFHTSLDDIEALLPLVSRLGRETDAALRRESAVGVQIPAGALTGRSGNRKESAMTNTQTGTIGGTQVAASARAEALARRLELGIDAMIAFASTLTERQWQTPIPKDGRAVGVVVHHVASVLPIEIQLAQQLAEGTSHHRRDVGRRARDERQARAGQRERHEAGGDRPAAPEQRGGRRGHSRLHRRAARHRGDELALRRRAADQPAHARGPRRAAQLPPPGQGAGGGEAVGPTDVSNRRAIMTTATTTATTAAPDLAAVKTRQQAMWASGDFAVIGTTLQIVGEMVCEAVDLRAGERVLDVAAGNGNATLAAARRFAEVTSTDYVPALLDGGRRRAEAEGFSIRFEPADAENLPYGDASFDVVLSTFGVMFAPDHQRSASELMRVCRPGRPHRPRVLDADRLPRRPVPRRGAARAAGAGRAVAAVLGHRPARAHALPGRGQD